MKLVILDRDGVINHDSDQFIKSPEEWQAIPHSLDAIAVLNQYGYKVAVATNQSGMGRGLFTMSDLNAIHLKMLKAIREAGGEIEGIWFCPHIAKEHCRCRKPNTGMVVDILDRLNGIASRAYMVGDARRDLECIAQEGGKPVLVLTGKGNKTLKEGALPQGTQVFDSLWDFAQDLCLKQPLN